jgi:hypothetical protein
MIARTTSTSTNVNPASFPDDRAVLRARAVTESVCLAGHTENIHDIGLPENWTVVPIGPIVFTAARVDNERKTEAYSRRGPDQGRYRRKTKVDARTQTGVLSSPDKRE